MKTGGNVLKTCWRLSRNKQETDRLPNRWLRSEFNFPFVIANSNDSETYNYEWAAGVKQVKDKQNGLKTDWTNAIESCVLNPSAYFSQPCITGFNPSPNDKLAYHFQNSCVPCLEHVSNECCVSFCHDFKRVANSTPTFGKLASSSQTRMSNVVRYFPTVLHPFLLTR